MKTYKHCGKDIDNVVEGIYQYETTCSNNGNPVIQIYDTNCSSGNFVFLNKKFNTLIFEKGKTYYFYYCEECGLVKISNENKILWNKRYYK